MVKGLEMDCVCWRLEVMNDVVGNDVMWMYHQLVLHDSAGEAITTALLYDVSIFCRFTLTARGSTLDVRIWRL